MKPLPQIPIDIINKILEYEAELENKCYFTIYNMNTQYGKIRLNRFHPFKHELDNVLLHKFANKPKTHDTIIFDNMHSTNTWTLPEYVKKDEDYVYQPYYSITENGHYIYLLDECPLSEYTLQNPQSLPKCNREMTPLTNQNHYSVLTRFYFNRGTIYHNNAIFCIIDVKNEIHRLVLETYQFYHVICAKFVNNGAWIFSESKQKWIYVDM